MKIQMRDLPIALAIGVGVGAYVALSDATLFRSVVPPAQTAWVITTSAIDRITDILPFTMFDEIFYRLILVSALAWLLRRVIGGWGFPVAIAISALVAWPLVHYAYFAGLPFTGLTMTREVMLHGVAGIAWGAVYWRYGIMAAMVGHASAHLSLQPLLGLFFG